MGTYVLSEPHHGQPQEVLMLGTPTALRGKALWAEPHRAFSYLGKQKLVRLQVPGPHAQRL